jgi:homoserine/homoserine lactone efflux protein
MHSLHVINWAAFLVAATLVSATPGANQLLGFRNAVRFGFPWAGIGIAARLVGLAMVIAVVVFGLEKVFAASPVMMTVVKWIGVAYLLFLGVAAIRAQPAAPEMDDDQASSHRRAGRGRIPRDEFVTATTNPKALLLFAALFPQFATPGPDSHVQIAVLGVAYLLVEAVVGSCYAGAGAVLRTKGPSSGTLRRVDRAAGGCFIVLAAALAVESF